MILDHQSHILELSFGNIHISTVGNELAQTLIIAFHGQNKQSQNATIWKDLFDSLELQHKGAIKLVAVDLPGYGNSENHPECAELFKNTELTLSILDEIYEKITMTHNFTMKYLLGKSWGGALSILYALKYPHKLDGIIVSAPDLFSIVRAGRSFIGTIEREFKETLRPSFVDVGQG